MHKYFPIPESMWAWAGEWGGKSLFMRLNTNLQIFFLYMSIWEFRQQCSMFKVHKVSRVEKGGRIFCSKIMCWITKYKSDWSPLNNEQYLLSIVLCWCCWYLQCYPFIIEKHEQCYTPLNTNNQKSPQNT